MKSFVWCVFSFILHFNSVSYNHFSTCLHITCFFQTILTLINDCIALLDWFSFTHLLPLSTLSIGRSITSIFLSPLAVWNWSDEPVWKILCSASAIFETVSLSRWKTNTLTSSSYPPQFQISVRFPGIQQRTNKLLNVLSVLLSALPFGLKQPISCLRRKACGRHWQWNANVGKYNPFLSFWALFSQVTMEMWKAAKPTTLSFSCCFWPKLIQYKCC